MLLRVGLIILLFLENSEWSQSAKILGVFPVPSYSHQIVYRAYMFELLKQGHEVVMVTTDPVKEYYENLTIIDLRDGSYKIWKETAHLASFREDYGTKYLYDFYMNIIYNIMEYQLSIPEMKALLREKFDLVVVESYTPLMLGFCHHMRAPCITIASMTGLLVNYMRLGNPTHCLLYKDMFSTNEGKLNVLQKIDELHLNLINRYTEWKHSQRFNALATQYFGDDTPLIEEMETKVDLLFLNVHPLFRGIRPTVPAIVYIGGIHTSIKEENRLPQNLQNYLDQSSQGIIYFSLGSNVMSKDLPPEKLQIFMKVFSQLPYNIMWKWENDTMPGKPDNVFVSKWMPQRDILAHSNVKLFIMQGGQQSFDEALHTHVPLVGIPFYGDQDINVRNFVEFGVGIGLTLASLNEDILREAIIEVAENKTYKENIKKLSSLLKDEPMSAAERAVWWTHYVLRHQGAPHLRAPAAGLPAWEFFLLDVAALLVTVAALTVAGAYYLFKLAYLRTFSFATKKKIQ